MSHLVISLGKDRKIVENIISSKKFDVVYVVTDSSCRDFDMPSLASSVRIVLMVMDFHQDIISAVNELSDGLKESFKEDKVLDLDIAVNIESGDGKMHSIILSSLMRMGYGIRLISFDSHTKNIVEL